ncbi:hypothetical protein SPSIL_036400 [Sporomusa silvacetica DSM 10669]|uniref:Uncharacterized protein n=1 Tax=Sporomusa silvacetica DSM 10669 TaxID=1123289 RepID=A0ABZ3IPF5_9FIRM|nr:hypothetical protein SPSIL_17460 [Sporomusa silvacetica DSM 10669]
MSVGSLLLKSFWANEAVFQLIMLAYIRTARSTILKLAFDYPYKDVYLRYDG